MNTPKTVLARFVLSVFAGLLFWSSWSWSPQGARVLPIGGLPYLQYKAFEQAAGKTVLPKRQWKKLPPAQKKDTAIKAKLNLSRRLNDIIADPAKISAADVKAVDIAWGKDAAKMLELLRSAN